MSSYMFVRLRLFLVFFLSNCAMDVGSVPETVNLDRVTHRTENILNVSLLSIWMTGSVLQECPKTESSLFPCTVLELWQRCFGLSIVCDSKRSWPLLANLRECSVCANTFCSTYEPLGGTINYYTDVFSSVTYPVLGFLVDCLRIEDTCWVFFLSKVKLT